MILLYMLTLKTIEFIDQHKLILLFHTIFTFVYIFNCIQYDAIKVVIFCLPNIRFHYWNIYLEKKQKHFGLYNPKCIKEFHILHSKRHFQIHKYILDSAIQNDFYQGQFW